MVIRIRAHNVISTFIPFNNLFLPRDWGLGASNISCLRFCQLAEFILEVITNQKTKQNTVSFKKTATVAHRYNSKQRHKSDT